MAIWAVDALEADKELLLGFHSTVTSRNWGLTLPRDDDGNPAVDGNGDPIGDYGDVAYTTELVDNTLYLGGTSGTYLLDRANGDYSFKQVQLVWTQSLGSENSPTATGTDTDYVNYAPLELYYTLANGTEHLAGTLERTGASNYNFSSADGVTAASGNVITLPDDVIGLRVTHTGAVFQTVITMYVSVALYPTDHVKNLNSNTTAGGYKSFYNYATGSAYYPTTNKAYKSAITYTYYYLYRSGKGSYIYKTATTPANDVNNSQSTLNYTIYAYEYKSNYYSWMSVDDMKELLTEQKSSVFYDLLPAGITPNLDSLVVRLYGSNTLLTLGMHYTVNLVDDWQGSDQTMMIISIDLPDTMDNYYYTNTSNLFSGFSITYKATYKYSDMVVYGLTNKLNSVAYRSLDGTLTGGTTASATSGLNSAYKPYFSDLDHDGNVDDTDNNTIYASYTSTFNPLLSALTGFFKTVKAADETSYSESTEVPMAGSYTYRLTFSNDEHQTSDNIIFYDFFETDGAWKGSFEQININQLQRIGVDPIVYYSTMADIGAANADLTDSSVWTTTKPSDLNTVTAIAVDCRHADAENKNIFKLQEGEQLIIYVTMRAPQYPVTDSGGATAYEAEAINLMHGSAKTYSATKNIERNVEKSNAVYVTLREPDVAITKSSDPESGTAASPTVVSRGTEIKYTISVQNTNTTVSLADVYIEDLIADDLTIKDIMYYFGTDTPAPIEGADRVTVEKDRQKLTFYVDKLSGKETIHFVVNTTVNDNTQEQSVIENIATITCFDGYDWEIDSNTTYHRTDTSMHITATKELTGATLKDNQFSFQLTTLDDPNKVVASDPNDAQGIITLSELCFTKIGTYEYLLSEVNSGSAGISYDSRRYLVTVTVTDDDNDGKLDISYTLVAFGPYQDDEYSETAVFKNTYSYGSASFILTASKVLSGATLQENQFSFSVKDNQTGLVLSTPSNNADGSIIFPEIYINEAGTYSYKYENKGTDSNLVYDESIFIVNVTAREADSCC